MTDVILTVLRKKTDLYVMKAAELLKTCEHSEKMTAAGMSMKQRHCVKLTAETAKNKTKKRETITMPSVVMDEIVTVQVLNLAGFVEEDRLPQQTTENYALMATTQTLTNNTALYIPVVTA